MWVLDVVVVSRREIDHVVQELVRRAQEVDGRRYRWLSFASPDRRGDDGIVFFTMNVAPGDGFDVTTVPVNLSLGHAHAKIVEGPIVFCQKMAHEKFPIGHKLDDGGANFVVEFGFDASLLLHVVRHGDRARRHDDLSWITLGGWDRTKMDLRVREDAPAITGIRLKAGERLNRRWERVHFAAERQTRTDIDAPLR